MKYGIITHYDVHNHGALLQLNALKQILNNLGIEASALQFDKNYDFMGPALKAKYEIGVRSLNIYVKYLLERGISSVWYNYNKRKILDRFRKSAQLIGSYYTECEKLDGVVIGSDEVFALHTGITPVFWGYALPSDKVFAYGGCFGPTTIDDIDKRHCRIFVASGLKSMCGLGMRDQNSIYIAKELTGKDVELVCDPVILYGYEKEISSMCRPLKDRYMIIYSYDNYLNEKHEILAIRQYARKHNLKIISPGFFHKWANKNINCSPIELLNWFHHAEYVVTNTFHGCVMSIITGREMAIKLRDNGNKLFNLMQEYEITNRIIDNEMKLDEAFNQKIDWNRINSLVKKYRVSSLEYIKRMIAK